MLKTSASNPRAYSETGYGVHSLAIEVKGGESMALYGIYGRHEIKDCPLNSSESRRLVLDLENPEKESDVCTNYKINNIVGRYHSGLEHTFLWIVDAEDPHLLQQRAIDTGMASFNEIKIVPLMTFDDVMNVTKKLEQN